MEKLTGIHSTLQTMTSIKNENQISDNRCEICSKHLHIKDGKEFCFHCEFISKQDKQLAEETMKEHERVKRERIQQLFNAESLINDKLKQANFSNYNTTNQSLIRAKDLCMQYATRFNKDNPVSLLLKGTFGIGKSHLAKSIIDEIIKKEFTGIFISVPKMLTKLKATYNKNSQHSEDKLLEVLEKVDCLVLDDIGAEQSKGNDSWGTSKLFEIIDSRIGKHTIFTTNYEVTDLKEKLGGRNFSRMMENVHMISMDGDDYRLKEFKG